MPFALALSDVLAPVLGSILTTPKVLPCSTVPSPVDFGSKCCLDWYLINPRFATVDP